MLEASGGGGFSGEDWSAKTVVQMWAAVQNQDPNIHYDALDGWQKSVDLLADHQGQVQNYRNNLASAWPPEKSPAAAAYLARLDALVKSIGETHDAATANHQTYASAILSLSLARQKVKTIFDEYQANDTKLTEFANKPPQGGLQKHDPPKPPVADGRQAELTRQAQSVMFGLSAEIISATTQFKTPTPYKPGLGFEVNDKDKDGGVYVPPILPGVGSDDSGNRSTGGTQVATPQTFPHSGSTALGVPGSSLTGPRQPGLVLGGIQPAPVLPPAPPMVTPPLVGGGSPFPPTITPTPILPTPSAGFPGGLPPGSGLPKPQVQEGLGQGFGRAPEGGMRAMPPGGVIGGNPGVGLGVGQPGAAARSAARVNPVGGVIEPVANQGRPGVANRGGNASNQPYSNVGGRGVRRKSEQEQHWDPTDPWATEGGVAPVLVPEKEQRVDPGPAIGLN